MCAVIAQGRCALWRKGARAGVMSPVTIGSSRWLSARAPPWPGVCLATGCTPASSSPRPIAAPSAPTATGSGLKARSPITTWAPGRPRSSTGAVTMSNPAAAQSNPIRAPVSHAARKPAASSVAYSRPIAAAAGWARQSGGRSRATRPPSWSTISTASAGRQSRSSATSAASWSRPRMLRANRITPAGAAARSSAASAASRAAPAMPTMAAFKRRPPKPSERRRGAARPLRTHTLAEGGRLRCVGEGAGPQAPIGLALSLGPRDGRPLAGEQIGHLVCQPLPFLPRLILAAQCCELNAEAMRVLPACLVLAAALRRRFRPRRRARRPACPRGRWRMRGRRWG